jgi:hypothetical protein
MAYVSTLPFPHREGELEGLGGKKIPLKALSSFRGRFFNLTPYPPLPEAGRGNLGMAYVSTLPFPHREGELEGLGPKRVVSIGCVGAYGCTPLIQA